MNELLVLFGSPCGSAAALMSGVLPLLVGLHVGFPLGVFAQLPGLVGGSRVLCVWQENSWALNEFD